MSTTVNMWDVVARVWETEASKIDEHSAPATAKALERAGLREGAHVIDVACGTGSMGLAAASVVGPSGRVVMSDLAAEMVAGANRRAADLPQATATLGDLANIEAPDATFDALVCRYGLMFPEDRVAAVREWVRVLRPGGRVATVTWGPRAENPWLGVAFDAVGAQFGTEFPPAGTGPFSLHDADALAQTLRDGGLSDVTIDRVPVPMRAASIEEWWETTIGLAGPLTVVYNTLEPPVQEAIRDRAIAGAREAAAERPDGVELPGIALVASGTRAA